MHARIRPQLASLLALALSVLAAPAHAEDGSALTATPRASSGDEAFNEEVKRGLEAFQGQRYPEAISAFRKAYTLHPEPELLYDIGRVHERAGSTDEAIQAYRRFLAVPGTTAALRSKALDNLNALTHEKMAREQSERDRAELSARAQSAHGSVPPSALAASANLAPSRSHTGEIVLVSGGAAAIGAGVLFGVLARNKKNDFDHSTDLGQKLDLRDASQRDSKIADVCYGVGIAAAGAGLLWWALGDSSSSSSDVAVMPSVGPSGALALDLSGRF